MPENSPSIYAIMAERVANAILGKINALIGGHNTNTQAHQDIRENIPGASSTTPSADTTAGGVGAGTTWARSDHTHPKSSLYAEASHNHTKSNITDFPTIPSKTSQLTNDSGFLTTHQSLSNYYNKSETNNYDVDFILGTQTASTSAWTGTTSVISSLRAGTTIFYKLPYASTNTSVTLNLTLKGGGTTGAKNVFYKNTTRVTTHFGVGQVIGLTYDGTAWYVISPSDNNSNNDNNYGGVQFKAGEALTTQTICCAKDNGQYYKVANGVVLDIRYPLIMTSSAVTSGTTTNTMYRTWYGVNIANTKSMTLTNGSQLFLEGTAYSNGKFTISSNVVTHTLTNGRYYIKVGTALSTTQIRFISDMTVYYYNGTTLKPVIKKDQIVDFPTIPSASSVTPSADTTSGSVGNGTTWARSDHAHPQSSLYAESAHAHSIEDTDLFDVLDCINVNFNNLDNIYLLDTVFNISNYNGLPYKNSSVVNDILRNNAVSGISLNKEFTPSTKYILEFDYYTSVSNRNGFYFGADPLLEDGVSINNSNDGLQVLVDVSNTYVETFNGTSSPTNVYTHTSNLFTSGTHHIRIVRNNTNVTFYIDDVELYTYTNAKYNTIGLNKWGGGYNTISNIEIKIGG